jgi:predicted PurR-regulated permease PerM
MGRHREGREKSSLAALASLIIIAIIVFLPLAFIVIQIYGETNTIYAYLINESDRAQFINTLNNTVQTLQNYFPNIYPGLSFDSFNIVTILQNGVHWVFDNFTLVFGEVSRIVIGFFVMCLALFYFLRDGHELKHQIIMLSPLGDVDDEHIMIKLEQAIRSIFVGSISVGLLQGLSMGTAFAVFGVPDPVLWGTVTVVVALIPGVGTGISLISGIVYLLFNGLDLQALGLLLWGSVAIALIDNTLGPYLVNRGIKIHQFLVLLSVLGGIIFFGAIGFVLGPLVLAFLFSLLEIYRAAKRRVA